MIECQGGKIYTGITVNVQTRFAKHIAGKGAKFTRSNPPVKLLAQKEYPNRSCAAQAEYALKKLPPLKKRAWIASLGVKI
jgi:putative endonuclease